MQTKIVFTKSNIFLLRCPFYFAIGFLSHNHKMSSQKNPTTKRIWNPDDTEKLYEKFRTKEIDPKNQTPTYIRRFHQRSDWIKSIYPKPSPFYRTYRHHADVYIAEQEQHGIRKGK